MRPGKLMRGLPFLSAALALFMAAAGADAAPPQQMPATKVVLDKVVERKVAKTMAFVGTVGFDELSDVAPEVPGKIRSQSIKEGSFVKKGDVLVELDTEILAIEGEVLEKQVDEARVRLENSERRVKRYKELFEKGVVSEQTYDDELYKQKELEKGLETTQKQLERNRTVIQKSVVRAPFNGLVLEKLLDVGEWAKTDAPVCKLASTDEVYVGVAVPEDIVRFVSPGDSVKVEISSLGRELNGTVKSVVPVAEVRSRNFTIKVKIPYIKRTVQNMSATVHVPVSPEMKLSVLKRAAVVQMQGSNFVFTVKDGKSAILPVNIVAYMDEYVGVDNPYIVPGMSVVIEGNDRLMPDSPVEVVGGK